MKGFLLFLVACLSFCISVPFALIYAIWNGKGDFFTYAISVDQTINAICGEFFNFAFLKDKKLNAFGDMDKTISYNLGKNKSCNNLNKLGLLVCFFLNLIDKNHVEKAFENKT